MSALRDEMLTGEAAAPYGESQAAGPWVLFWSAVWVGVLAAFALVVVFGLLSVALGASPGVGTRGYTRWRDFGAGGIFLGVLGAFLSFAAGGWTTGKIIGPHRAEVGTLHAAIVWLLAVPVILLMGTLGSATFFGAWYGGLAGVPAWVAVPLGQASPEALAVARQAAIAGLAALLISLVGAVVGGWMASGEPMTLTHYRTRGRVRVARPSVL